jgi:phage head maturation protease
MLRTKVFRADETKILDEATGRVSAIVSSESIDRDGDVIRAAGWDLKNFMRHPVVLANHDYSSLRSQIGVWEKMEVQGTKMRGVARFFIGKGNDEADWAFELAKEKALAFSVGFIPDMEKASPLYEDDAFGTRGMEFKSQELLEVSAVTVPSNPDALQRIVKEIGVDPVVAEIAEERLADMPSNSIGEEQVEAIAVKVVALLRQMAPAEVEPEAEAEEPETPEPEESGQDDDGEAENVVEEFDPYAVAIAAAEAVLMEDER